MAGSLWLLVVFKNPLLWALHSKQLPLEFYVHILKQNGFATSQVYKSQSSPINVYFYSSMQDHQSREARSTGLHLGGLYYPKIRELEQACLQQPTSTRSGLFAFLGSCYGQISFQRIVSIRITTLRDTHLVASRYNKVENTSLNQLMNIALENTSLLKLSIIKLLAAGSIWQSWTHSVNNKWLTYQVIKYSCSNCITYQPFSIFNLHLGFEFEQKDYLLKFFVQTVTK